jgi:alpha-mannosidase
VEQPEARAPLDLFTPRGGSADSGARRPWELLLLPHSHVDIGYTEFPDILADAHGDYIAQALDLMTETDTRPEAERYRWTCESFWTVEQFLRRHPERRPEMMGRMREGRIEVTAAYANMTDLVGVDLLERSIRPAAAFCREAGVPLLSACNYDVNGFPWDLPRVLKQHGVRYLDTAINEVRSLGVRPRPRPYRWASADGSDVLLWHSPGYLAGNDLLLHASAAMAETPVADLLRRLVDGDYPFHALGLLISGVTGDSMPPDGAVCDVVRDWNARWRYPRLRIATVSEWLAAVEREWPEPIARHQAAWCDWWADGNASAAYESALVRGAQARLVSLDAQRASLAAGGVDLGRLDGEYDAAWRRAMLFCEHTFGAYETAVAPDSPATRGQWHSKAAHAYAAAALCDSLSLEQAVAAATGGAVSARRSGLTNATLQGAPSGYLAGGAPPAVLAYNPLDRVRDQVLSVHIPGHFAPDAAPVVVDPRTGAALPAVVGRYPPEDVVNSRHWRVELAVPDLPARAHLALPIRPGAAPPEPEWRPAEAVENARWAVRVDPETGILASLFDKLMGRELAQPRSAAQPYGLGQCVYETVDGPQGRNAVASWHGIGDRHVPFARTSPLPEGPARARSLPFAEELEWRLAAPGGLRLRVTVRLAADGVLMVHTLEKPETDAAEALYVAFPLLSPHAGFHLHAAGAAFRPGVDQVPGTATDWHSVQDYFAVSDADTTVVVASPDVPLVQCGGINTGLWRETLPSPNGLVMSWVMNNYWFTNFPLRQGGQFTFRYALGAFAGPFDAEQAGALGQAVRHPAWAHAVRRYVA